MSKVLMLAVLSALILVSSCASRKSGWENQTEATAIPAAELKTIQTEAMSHWKARLNQENLVEALKRFERMHATAPDDLVTLIYLTRGYYFLADSHIQEIEKKKATYEKAAAFGEKAMATNKNFKDKVSAGKTTEEALDALTAKEVPAIYWTAASLGKWAKATGIAAALKYKTRIKAMISRVEKLDPNYFFAAPSRYWGGFYAVAPSFAGGDMKKSREQFDKSLKAAPEYQGTKVLMADVYWTKMGDKAQFKRTLEEVLASQHDNHPEIGPENALEKKKAEKLLQNIDELF